MATIYFSVDTGANIHSRLTRKLDTVADLGLEKEEWEELAERERADIVIEWANQQIETNWSYEKPTNY